MVPAGTAFNDRIYSSYISLEGSQHRPFSPEERLGLINAYKWYLEPWLRDHNRESWLDLACGQGILLNVAQRCGFRDVRGVDSSGEMVAVARAAGVSVEEGDALEHLRSKDDKSISVISAFDFLEHLEREECLALLKEIHRALKSDGVLLVKVPNGASPWSNSVFHSDLTHRVLYTPASLVLMMSLAGFRSCECRELRPPRLSWKGRVRACLWPLVRVVYGVCEIIETGSMGFGVKTRVMIARARP